MLPSVIGGSGGCFGIIRNRESVGSRGVIVEARSSRPERRAKLPQVATSTPFAGVEEYEDAQDRRSETAGAAQDLQISLPTTPPVRWCKLSSLLFQQRLINHYVYTESAREGARLAPRDHQGHRRHVREQIRPTPWSGYSLPP
jgi:hypothetical protein